MGARSGRRAGAGACCARRGDGTGRDGTERAELNRTGPLGFGPPARSPARRRPTRRRCPRPGSAPPSPLFAQRSRSAPWRPRAASPAER